MPLYDLAYLNTHIVDLTRSKVDLTRSNKERGVYYFDPAPDSKVYVKTSDYMDSASRPPFLFKFIDKDKFGWYMAKFGAEPLTINDPYWPETMVPAADGVYSYMDGMFVKIPDMQSYIDFRQTERSKGNGGFAESSAEFNRQSSGERAGLTSRDREELKI
jgi:hypothetical protein